MGDFEAQLPARALGTPLINRAAFCVGSISFVILWFD
jgi:hypothetical protein